MTNVIHGAGMILEQYYLQKCKFTWKDELSQTFVTDACYIFLLHFSTPDPDNVLIVKTPEGVFSTKFFIQNNEKQSPARLTNNENHQVPATFSDCPAARCLPYDMLRNKVFSVILFMCAPPLLPYQSHRIRENIFLIVFCA
jgi:hypothetical protein